MNTTKLHIIATILTKEFKRTNSVATLSEAVTALHNSVKQSSQPNFQQELTKQLDKLYQNLDGSPVDDFSPIWTEALAELNLSESFGSGLEARVRSIFERNSITPQSALDELKKVHVELESDQKNLSSMVDAFTYFSVGEDALETNEVEVGLVIPRAYVDDNMKSFGTELVKMEKSLLVFSELVTGQREPLKIRNISSSELSVFLEYAPEVAACLAVAVERIVALYNNILQIQAAKRKLVDLDVPENMLEGINNHAQSIVGPQLEELGQKLIDEHGGHLEEGRRREVGIEVRQCLNMLANRIDRGVNIEIRTPLEADEADDQENEEAATTNAQSMAMRQVRSSASKIEYRQRAGAPVLFLPEGESLESEE